MLVVDDAFDEIPLRAGHLQVVLLQNPLQLPYRLPPQLLRSGVTGDVRSRVVDVVLFAATGAIVVFVICAIVTDVGSLRPQAGEEVVRDTLARPEHGSAAYVLTAQPGSDCRNIAYIAFVLEGGEHCFPSLGKRSIDVTNYFFVRRGAELAETSPCLDMVPAMGC
ncbi:MAG: hypothetical protein AAF368_18965 [Planctomycetota bacterium]